MSRARKPLGLNPTLVPACPVEIDWSHPLAAGLVALYLPGVGLRDLTGYGPALTPSGSPYVQAGPLGPEWVPNGAALSVTRSDVFPGLTAIAGVRIFGTGSGENNEIFEIGLDSSGPSIQLECNNALLGCMGYMGGWKMGTSDANITPGAPYRVGGIWAGAWAHFFQNGIETSSSIAVTAGQSAAPLGSTSPWSIGATTSGGKPLNGAISDIRVFNRALSASDMAWINAEPYAMLRPIARRKLYLVSSGSVAIAAGPGTAYASGSAGGVAAGAATSPGSGAVYASGLSASVSAGSAIAPGVGSVIASGRSAGASAGVLIGASSGAVYAAGSVGGFAAGAYVLPGAGAIYAAGAMSVVSTGVVSASVSPGPGWIYAAGAQGVVTASAAFTPSPARTVSGVATSRMITGYSVSRLI